MKTQRFNQFISGLFAALFIGLAVMPLTMSSVSAQEAGGGGLRVPPGPLQFDIYPGESKSFEIPVRNITPSPLSVKMEVNDFQSDGATGDPVIVFNDKADPNNPFSIRPYVEGPEFFDLAVDEEKILQYTITLPTDANPGARFGVMRFIANGGPGADEGVTLTASLGTIIIVNTPGDAVELISLKDLKVVDEDGNSGSLFESAPKQVVVKLSNEGNTFVRPFGNVEVKNWNGDVVQSTEFNSGETRPGMLPQSQRDFEIILENISGYGKYTVQANISYGDGTNIIPATVTFWVIPWKLLLIAFVVIVLIVIAANRGLKVYKRNVIKSTKTEKHKPNKTK
jgi:hypothetical protein